MKPLPVGTGRRRVSAASLGRREHFFNNPAPLGRNAVFGYRLPAEERKHDNKGKGLLHAPWPTKGDKAARKRDGRIPPYEKPPFDRRGAAAATLGFEFTTEDDQAELLFRTITTRGSYCSATWEHAKLGNASATVSAKVGETKSYAELVHAAEEVKVKRIAARKIDDYGYRGWSAVRRTYGDIRSGGKVGRVIDITYEQAANRDVHTAIFYEYRGPERRTRSWQPISSEALADSLEDCSRLRRVLLRRLRVFGSFVGLRDGLSWLHVDIITSCILWRHYFRLFDGERILQSDKWERRIGQSTEWKPPNLNSEHAEARNEHIKTQTPPKQIVEFPKLAELLDAHGRAKSGDHLAIQKIIAWHQPVVKSVAAEFVDRSLSYSQQTNQREEFISCANAGVPNENGECFNGIFYALEKYDPDNIAGKSFGEFAKEPIRWAIQSYLLKQRKHNIESLSINKNIDDTEDDMMTFQDFVLDENTYDEDSIVDVDGLTESERRLSAMSGALADALDSLDERSRRIFEARHGLKGTATLTLAELASTLGVTEPRIHQIEAQAWTAVTEFLKKMV